MKPLKCNDCTLCCRGQAITFNEGDDETLRWVYEPDKMLDHNPDGSCIYLQKNKCTIYENRPHTCREFDCRVMAKRRKKHEVMDIKIWERGKELLKKDRYRRT